MNVWKTKDNVRASMKTMYNRVGCAKSKWIKEGNMRNPSNFSCTRSRAAADGGTAKSRGTKGDQSLLNSREWLQRKHCLERRGLDMDWTSNAQGSFVLIHVDFVWFCSELTNY